MNNIKNQIDKTGLDRMTSKEAAEIFGDTYEKVNGSLHKLLAHQVKSKEEVDDLSQDVYLRVIQNLKPEKKPSWSFVKTIATNLLRDRFRKRKTQEVDTHFSVDDVDQKELVSGEASPKQILEAKKLYMVFSHVIDSVKPTSRRAFMLHRAGGLTYKEIAQEMGISKRMVKHHLSCVLLQLRKKIGELA